MIRKFGFVAPASGEKIECAMAHSGTLYAAIMDREALWDPATIEKILASFPAGHIDESDLFLILAECVANAVLHGQAEALGLHARARGGVLLISFYQVPPMLARIRAVLDMASKGCMRECTEEIPGGLGFPILLRLVHRITISGDFCRLQLWLRRKTPFVAA